MPISFGKVDKNRLKNVKNEKKLFITALPSGDNMHDNLKRSDKIRASEWLMIGKTFSSF